MNFTSLTPTRREWTVADAGRPGESLTLRGWDFGGDGRPVLLHHANGFCSGTLALLAEYLTPHFHVFAADARGHGDSDSSQVPNGFVWSYLANDWVQVAEQILRATGETKLAAGVGSSFGGIITAAAAAQADLFDVVVMLDPPIHPNPDLLGSLGLPVDAGASPGDHQGELVAQTLKRRAVWPSRSVVREAWSGKAMFADWLPRGFDLYLDQAFRDLPNGEIELKCHPTVEAHIFGSTGSLSPLEFAPQVKAPVLLAGATRSFGVASFFEALVGLFPRGRYIGLDGGHLLPLEVPELCAQTVLDFIAEQ